MRKKEDWFTRLGRQLDLPGEALPGGFGLTLSGTEQLTVRGCRRILTYGPECIRFSLGRQVLAIRGLRLLCTVFEAGSVTVEGRIDVIAFENNVKGDRENAD